MNKLKNYYNNISYKKKLTISFVAIVIIPILFIGWFSYNRAVKDLKKQSTLVIQKDMGLLQSEIKNKIDKQKEFMGFLAYNPHLKQMIFEKDIAPYNYMMNLNESIETTIWYQISSFREIKSFKIYINDLDKSIGNFFLPIKEVESEQWFRLANRSNKAIDIWEDDKIIISQGIYNRNSTKKAGIISMGINIEDFFESLITTPSQAYALMLSDQSGNIVYQSGNEYQLHNDLKLILESPGTRIRINKENYLVFSQEIDSTGYFLTSYIKEKDIAKGSEKIINVTIVMIIICIIIVAILIFVFSRSLSKRINELNQMIEIVSEGDTKVVIKSEYNDEIGQITNRIGEMINRIDMLVIEVYKSKLDNKELMLKILQAQINPHFLYNTLSMINWKAKKIGAGEISEITKKLSKFYRTILNNGRYVTSIKNEIENIKAYIDIQLIMHDGSFKVIYNIDENMFPFTMINFTLQPIVENAIIHGIYETEEPLGILLINGYMENNNIYFEVIDNGPGMDEEVKNKIEQNYFTGYGLKNIKDRFNLYYEDFSMKVESVKNKGTKIIIRLPLMSEE